MTEEQIMLHQRSQELLARSKRDVARSKKKRYTIVCGGVRITTTSPERWTDYLKREHRNKNIEIKER